jgi:photosystem II stability/assembly factor-like uncharacterized protein
MKRILSQLAVSMIFLVISSHTVTAQWIQTTIQSNGVNGGYVEAIAVSGDNLFLGTFHGGIFFSNNNGETWTARNSGLPANVTIQSLFAFGTVLFAGSDSYGAFCSKDSGKSWNAVNSGLTSNNSKQVTSFASVESNLFVGTYDGVFRSIDTGATWTKVDPGWPATPWVKSLAVIGSALFASVSNGQKAIFRSTDNGTNWTQFAIPVGNLGNVAHINSLAASGTNLFAGPQSGGSDFNGIFLSIDSGTTWTTLNIPGLPSLSSVIALMTFGTNVFVAFYSPGGYTVYRSLDNGTSWAEMINSGLTNQRVLSFAVKGNALFAGTYGGGVFRSTDTGATWSAVNEGLSNTYVLSLAGKGANLFAGTQLGGAFRSIDTNVIWTPSNTGLPANSTVYSLEISGTDVFAGTDSGVYRSADNGTTWNKSNFGLPMVIPPGDTISTHYFQVNAFAKIGTNLFAGTDLGVFLSINNGASWSEVDTGLTDPYLLTQGTLGVISLAVCGANLYAGTRGHGVFLSSNNGISWRPVNSGMPLPMSLHFFINSFAVNGTYVFAGTGYRVFESPAITCSTGVFLSTDTGKSWTAVNSGLTNKCVSSLALNGTDLYAGTLGNGVFHSADSGKSWTTINSGLPDSSWISSLMTNGINLFAGTHYGGLAVSEIAPAYEGIWRLPLPEAGVKTPQAFLPEKSAFKLNFSNGSHSKITLHFTLPRSEQVTVKIYDLSGKEITSLVNNYFGSGAHRLTWNTRNLTSGCYTVKLQAGPTTYLKSIPIFR